ncbi:NAD(P)H-binding protein [Amycolatopsis tucumanensis]|uniref:NAD(P)H-binding protein n=1 Tax=Amycolatopsis tucumanensis TaxID=401106 RepID=UPI003D728E28
MRILVTGATGNVGRLVVDELLAAGASEVRALTTDPVRAALPPEVEVVEGYLGRVETLPRALEGVDRMYLAPLTRTVREVTELAREAGVTRIVDLAGPEGSWWYDIEKAVEHSGIPWTHLEAGEFMTNTTIWADQIRSRGEVREAYPRAANAPIALEDIAAVAAKALLEDGHEGAAYGLTGPETLTRAELVAQIGQALGREIPLVEVSHADALADLTETMGADAAAWYLDGCAEMAEHPQPVSPAVSRVLGRPGMRFAEWAVAHAALFR